MPTDYDKLEVNVSVEDKQALGEHIDAINKILEKYPYFVDAKAHYVTAMSRAKNAGKDLAEYIRWLHVNNQEDV
jgi:hypothetical protein